MKAYNFELIWGSKTSVILLFFGKHGFEILYNLEVQVVERDVDMVERF